MTTNTTHCRHYHEKYVKNQPTTVPRLQILRRKMVGKNKIITSHVTLPVGQKHIRRNLRKQLCAAISAICSKRVQSVARTHMRQIYFPIALGYTTTNMKAYNSNKLRKEDIWRLQSKFENTDQMNVLKSAMFQAIVPIPREIKNMPTDNAAWWKIKRQTAITCHHRAFLPHSFTYCDNRSMEHHIDDQCHFIHKVVTPTLFSWLPALLRCQPRWKAQKRELTKLNVFQMTIHLSKRNQHVIINHDIC